MIVRTIIGYHATQKDNEERIEKEGFIKSVATKRHMHWLGSGVYFFIDFYNALLWNGKDFSNKLESKMISGTKKHIIYKAIIMVEEDKYLDFSSRVGQLIIDYMKDGLKTILKKEGRATLIDKLNKRSPKYWIYFLQKYGFLDNYYAIAATFIEPETQYNITRYRDQFIHNKIEMVCVRNRECIKEYKKYHNIGKENRI